MSLCYAFFCSECFKTYDDTRKPCLGLCGDTICLLCAENLMNCPICKRVGAFSERKINYEQMRMVAELSVAEFAQSIFMPLKDDFGKCMQCGEESKKLRICVDCAKKEGIIQEQTTSFKPEDNLIFPVYNRAKHFSLCSSCTLDGEHSTHQIMPLISCFSRNSTILDIFPINNITEVVRATSQSAGFTVNMLFLSFVLTFAFNEITNIAFNFHRNKSAEDQLTFKGEEAKEIADQFEKHMKPLAFRAIAEAERFINMTTKRLGIFGRLGSWWIMREIRTILDYIGEPNGEELEMVDKRVREEVFKYYEDLDQNILLNTLRAFEKLKKAYKSFEEGVEIVGNTSRDESDMLAVYITLCDAFVECLMCFLVFMEMTLAHLGEGSDFEHENSKDYYAKFEAHRERKMVGNDKSKILFWLSE